MAITTNFVVYYVYYEIEENKRLPLSLSILKLTRFYCLTAKLTFIHNTVYFTVRVMLGMLQFKSQYAFRKLQNAYYHQ